MMASISVPRLALLTLLAALTLGAGCTVGDGANPAGGGPGTTASEQPTGGTGIQTPGTQAPATPYSSQATNPTNGTGGGQDSGAVPAGAPHTGAGGTAQGVNLVLFALGGLIATGGVVTLALRRRCVG